MFAAKTQESSKANADARPGKVNRETEPPRLTSINSVWHRLATRVQTKLVFGDPDDVYEQEADRVADQVMRMSQSQTQDGSAPTPPGGTGQPLPDSVRSYFEPRFGHDFSKVRIHTDQEANESARVFGARAYTLASDIVFGKERFAPGSAAGNRLLAHELTHVVQQDAAKPMLQLTEDENPTQEAESPGWTAGNTGLQMDQEAETSALEEGSGYGQPTLEDVPFAGYEAYRDAIIDSYWEGRNSIDPILDIIAVHDATEHQHIDDDIVRSDELLDELPDFEDMVIESAYFDETGALVFDDGLVAELLSIIADFEMFGHLFQKEGELWERIVALPTIEGLKELTKAWVSVLEAYKALSGGVVDLLAQIRSIYDKHQEEFEQACKKIGVDAALIVAGIAVAAAGLTPPGAIAAGVVLALTGVGASLAIEGKVGSLLQLKTALNAANIGRLIAENTKDIALVSEDLAKGLKALGPALNACSLVADSLEAKIEKSMVNDMIALMKSLETQYADLLSAWPAIVACLEAAAPKLELIEVALNENYDRIHTLDAEISTLEVTLHSE